MTAVFPELIGNVAFPESLLGFEVVGRACQRLMIEKLNDEIDEQSERWKAADLALQELTGGPVGQIDVEHVPAASVWEGPHKSLLDQPPEALPALNIMGYVINPDPDQLDQLETIRIRLYIEALVKAGPVPVDQETAFETIVHRRIQRTTEAVNAVVMRDRTLRGAVRPIQSLPLGGIGQSAWLRKEEKGRGPRWLWQGSRLEYTLQRQADF